MKPPEPPLVGVKEADGRRGVASDFISAITVSNLVTAALVYLALSQAGLIQKSTMLTTTSLFLLAITSASLAFQRKNIQSKDKQRRFDPRRLWRLPSSRSLRRWIVIVGVILVTTGAAVLILSYYRTGSPLVLILAGALFAAVICIVAAFLLRLEA
uniref:hypothetical protein n=1 Tax=Paractinoplanes polyasparticus TaxID=2856853 RepID=UPI001C864DFE|nr:hypothetical protein [Actinoplanes polyasparticus]